MRRIAIVDGCCRFRGQRACTHRKSIQNRPAAAHPLDRSLLALPFAVARLLPLLQNLETRRACELALYDSQGKLPKPESTHDFIRRT